MQWQPSQAPRDVAPGAGEPSDETLVTLAQHDRAAFALLYRRYATAIYRYCDRALGDRTAAEEATQTVFLRALAALPSCRDGSAFRPWLFAIAHNAIADARRARRPLVPLEGALEGHDTAASPEELALAGAERREITSLPAHLQDQEREIVELRLAGLRDKEIARPQRRGGPHRSVSGCQAPASPPGRSGAGGEPCGALSELAMPSSSAAIGMPAAPVTMRIRLIELPVDGRLPAPPDVILQQGVRPPTNAAGTPIIDPSLGTLRSGTLVNIGRRPVTAYVLSVESTGVEASTPAAGTPVS